MHQLKFFFRKFITLIKIFLSLPFFIFAPVILVGVYIVRPWFIFRFQSLNSSRIGHFAINTELYCCEKDMKINIPEKPYLDVFYFKDISNKQLAEMWKRELIILPSFLIHPIFLINKFFSIFFSFARKHDFSKLFSNYRDTQNLLSKSKPHISFSKNEKIFGLKQLKKFGLKENSKFVCLNVRDKTFLKSYLNKDWSYHNFRDSKIDDFIPAAETIAKRGYYVFRMGKKAEKPINTSNPMIIDYVNSKMRSDFLDVYLGAHCAFCLSTTSGFDQIPSIFRKPVAFITVPLVFFETFLEKALIITKHHYSKIKKRNLTLSEICSSDISCSFGTEKYKEKNIDLVDNTPREIEDLAIEMMDRVEDKWNSNEADNKLQKKFWNIYLSSNYNKFFQNKKFHGEVRAKFSARYLSNNPNWLL